MIDADEYAKGFFTGIVFAILVNYTLRYHNVLQYVIDFGNWLLTVIHRMGA
jgi:hypothetical protein